MQFPNPIPVRDLAKKHVLQLIGESDLMATGINEIHKVSNGDITFVDSPKYYERSLNSAASIIIIDKVVDAPQGKCILVHPQPFDIYEGIIKEYRGYTALDDNIHPSARIHKSAHIEPNVVIGKEVTIGANSVIRANTFIGDYTEIGDNVFIEPNCSIGTEAFYFKKREEGYDRWTTAGKVVIEDDVYLGSACTVARGVSGITRIGSGSKLDAQIQLGHGVVIGKNCLLASQVGIAGKTIIGDNVTIYGQVGIAQSLHIGDNCTILAKSGVSKDLEAGKAYFGYPAAEAKSKYREMSKIKRLIDE